MADHFFSIKPGEAGVRKSAAVTVGSSTAAGSVIELRVEDGACKAIQVANALEWLADCFRNRNPGVIPVDFLKD
ncbi:MAG: hypothetical protein AB7H90_03510 [Alphaproteobacteria bacterium]